MPAPTPAEARAGHWAEDEHAKFLAGLETSGAGTASRAVGTRTMSQARRPGGRTGLYESPHASERKRRRLEDASGLEALAFLASERADVVTTVDGFDVVERAAPRACAPSRRPRHACCGPDCVFREVARWKPPCDDLDTSSSSSDDDEAPEPTAASVTKRRSYSDGDEAPPKPERPLPAKRSAFPRRPPGVQYGYDGYDSYDGYGYGHAYASRRASPPALVPEWVWKLGSMLVAAAVVCFGFFLVKNVNELFKTNRRSKARVALPTKPAVEDANARRLAEDAARDEAKRMKAEEKASRQAATIALRSAAATAARRWRALAARFAARVAAARYVQRAWRYPGVLGARRAVRKARGEEGLPRRGDSGGGGRAPRADRPPGLAAAGARAGPGRAARRRGDGPGARRAATEAGGGGRRALAAMDRARARASSRASGATACPGGATSSRPRGSSRPSAARRGTARAGPSSGGSPGPRGRQEARQEGEDELAREAAAAARRAAAALWSSLRHGDACAALAVAGAEGPRADRVNGVYRRSLAGAAPLFRRAPRHDRGVVAS
ncbi:hypothetical protein JL722_9904 [Aureococcus anophagefferens]|nr:hypothetical protein JL722_9904 [Aureococcus anophagefferens]